MHISIDSITLQCLEAENERKRKSRRKKIKEVEAGMLLNSVYSIYTANVFCLSPQKGDKKRRKV